MDADNHVVKLCVAGMQAEGNGCPDEARALFERAWAAATSDYEACIAAHYVARHQSNAALAVHWNEEALLRAQAVGDDRVSGFYPSLHLNLGHAHEQLGDAAAACREYVLAEQRLADVPATPYAELIRHGVAAGWARTCGGGDQPAAEDASATATQR
jgi:hypothetical protein